MADEKAGQAEREQRPGMLGYDDLSMNEVPSSPTEMQSEAGRHVGGLALLVVAILVVAAFILLGIRALSNAPPGQEAEQRLRAKLADLPAWRSGVVMEARYLAGDRVRVGFSPRFSLANAQERERVEQAARDVMVALIEERPERDLYVDGFQGDEKVVSVRYRHKSTLIGPGGERIPDIAVHVAGEEDTAMTEAVGSSREASGSK